MRRRSAETDPASEMEEGKGGTFRGLVKQAGKYILNSMRMLRAALGLLSFCLIVALICCILAAIFIGFDLKSDLTTSVTAVVEEPDEDQPYLT